MKCALQPSEDKERHRRNVVKRLGWVRNLLENDAFILTLAMAVVAVLLLFLS